MKALERFPQIGGIAEYLALPPGEVALYRQYTLDAMETDAKQPVLRFEPKK